MRSTHLSMPTIQRYLAMTVSDRIFYEVCYAVKIIMAIIALIVMIPAGIIALIIAGLYYCIAYPIYAILDRRQNKKDVIDFEG